MFFISAKRKISAFLKRSKFFKKNLAFALLLVFIVAEFFLFLIFGDGVNKILSFFRKTDAPITGIILFEGEGCSQCDKVNNFIKENKIEDKITFTRLEVFNNMHNVDILEDKAQTCGLNPSQIGVPFLWDGYNCVIGYIDVINFFQKAAKKP